MGVNDKVARLVEEETRVEIGKIIRGGDGGGEGKEAYWGVKEEKGGKGRGWRGGCWL